MIRELSLEEMEFVAFAMKELETPYEAFMNMIAEDHENGRI